MAARVVGLLLEDALRRLESDGVPVESVGRVGPPADFRRRGPDDDRPAAEYIASQRELPNGAVGLLTVQVPAVPKQTLA
jgi:hypothetical protein